MIDPDVSDLEQTVGSITSSLLDRVRANDKQAWGRLVEMYLPLVLAWCRSKGLSKDDAFDTAQEVFQAVWRSLADFHHDREGDTFRGWLRTITKNKIRDLWRRKNVEPQAVGGSVARALIDNISLEPAEGSLASEVRRLFGSILEFVKEKINPQHWEVFWRVVVDGQHPGDVAVDMGIERHNVYIIKSRILRKLREEFGGARDVESS